LWLGQLYLEDGDAAPAVKHLPIARFLGADDKATLYSLARALRALGKIPEAKELEEKVIEMQRLSTRSSEVLFCRKGAVHRTRGSSEKKQVIQIERRRAQSTLDFAGISYCRRFELICALGLGGEQFHNQICELKLDPGDVNAEFLEGRDC
jgi:hypothetical protein